jgi:ketosteroid isomerase-like protein
MKQLFSITMLLFFFLGQVNLSWAKHYCEDILITSKVSVAPEKSDCCEDESEKIIACCEDQITTANSDDHFSKSEFQVSVSPDFRLAYTFSFFSILIPETADSSYQIDHQNLPIPDFQLLHQSFLI